MRDKSVDLVWETEGRRGAAERGWLGAEERERELERQRQEAEEHERSRAAVDELTEHMQATGEYDTPHPPCGLHQAGYDCPFHDPELRHVCGLTGYDPMKDQCPGCEARGNSQEM